MKVKKPTPPDGEGIIIDCYSDLQFSPPPAQESMQADEEEEKEVSEVGNQTSEETHGGNEATKSIEDSPSVADNGEQERGDSDENEISGKGGNNECDSNSNNENADDNGEEVTGSDGGVVDEDDEGADGDAEGEQDNEVSEGTDSSEQDSVEGEDCVEEGTESNTADDSEDSDEQSGGESEINYRSAIQHEYVSISKLKFAFYRLIDTLADVRVSEESGTEYLSTKKIVRRVLDRRPLPKCYVNSIRENIYVLLDDSGSMVWWANLLNAISSLSAKRKDIKILWTPNGMIYNDTIFGEIKGQNVIYVGDFDGGDTPYGLAKCGAKVIWFCPEDRYEDTSEHSWCHYSLSEYPKSVQFFRTLTLEDLQKAFKKVKKRW